MRKFPLLTRVTDSNISFIKHQLRTFSTRMNFNCSPVNWWFFFSKSIYVICDRDLNIVAKGTHSSSNCFDVIMMSVCSHFTFEVWPAFFGDYLVITQPHSHFRSTDYLSVAQHINRYALDLSTYLLYSQVEYCI